MTSDRVVARAEGLRRLSNSDAGLQILRATLMPVMVAILSERLGGTERVLPAVVFLEYLGEDLAALRDAGFDISRTPQEYLSEWARQGVLDRRPGEGREETVELSAPAQVAVRWAAQLETPHLSVTSSRLTNLAEQLARLAHDTDPEQASRLETLEKQRAQLDVEIEDVKAGRYRSLSDEVALERLAEILHLASEIPGDFAKVSADLEQLNRNLREQIIRLSGSRGNVLDEVFSDVDVIETSDAGRTFNAFHALVLDSERAADLDDSVSSVLDRGFTAALTRDEAVFLRRLLTTLQRESTQVRGAMTGFSRSLRRFVESQAYREHRRLAEALSEARAAAYEASRIARPFDSSGYELDASSIPLGSIGSWRLHNPADVRTADPVLPQESAPLDLAALRRQVRESEIDFEELRYAVIETLDRRQVASVGDVLADHPASQGLASVVGLLLLAESVGTRGAGSETLAWVSVAGMERTVGVGRYLFDHVPDDWRSA